MTTAMQKPPLGLRPKWVYLEERIEEISAAIKHYQDAGLPVPNEWRRELVEVQQQQDGLRLEVVPAPTVAILHHPV
jgi:hypothetical protein